MFRHPIASAESNPSAPSFLYTIMIGPERLLLFVVEAKSHRRPRTAFTAQHCFKMMLRISYNITHSQNLAAAVIAYTALS